jgi:hypothetical protein
MLSLSGSMVSVAAALESDLEPFHKLRRFFLGQTIGPAVRTATLVTAESPNTISTVSFIYRRFSLPNLKQSSKPQDQFQARRLDVGTFSGLGSVAQIGIVYFYFVLGGRSSYTMLNTLFFA